MKYTLLIALPFLFGYHLHAQKKLKMEIIKDTGDTLWSTAGQKIYTSPGGPKAVGDYLKTSVVKTKAGISLELEIQTGRTNTFTIPAGSSVEIHLIDDEVINLYANTDNSSRISRLNYGCYMFVFYRIPSKEFKRLQASPMKLIRVHASIGVMDYMIKEKFSDSLQEQLRWISGEE